MWISYHDHSGTVVVDGRCPIDLGRHQKQKPTCGDQNDSRRIRFLMAIGEPAGQLPGYRAGQIIMWAAKMIGRPYLWGAGGPISFDCSGLAWFCYSYGGWVNPDGSGRFQS